MLSPQRVVSALNTTGLKSYGTNRRSFPLVQETKAGTDYSVWYNKRLTTMWSPAHENMSSVLRVSSQHDARTARHVMRAIQGQVSPY